MNVKVFALIHDDPEAERIMSLDRVFNEHIEDPLIDNSFDLLPPENQQAKLQYSGYRRIPTWNWWMGHD